ncbi:hypothetical protein YC2023_008879 [Brassica napus]
MWVASKRHHLQQWNILLVRRIKSKDFQNRIAIFELKDENGIIDGQVEPWWGKFKRRELKYTRPYLIEIMHFNGIQIPSLTFFSPSWHIHHPVYSRLKLTRFNC